MGDPRNLAIALLAALVIALTWMLLRESAEGPPPPPPTAGRTHVSLLDVLPDREGRRHLDLLFDRPLGEGRTGDALDPPPAQLEPTVGGVWRWQGANVLRFTASDRFVPATRYQVVLDPETLVDEAHQLVGATRSSFVTDRFQVDRVEVREEPAPGGPRVVLRGTLFFNYPVDAEELAPRLRLADPGHPDIALELESRGARRELRFRSAEVEKRAAARELSLEIAAELTPAEGNVPLSGPYLHAIPIGSAARLEVRGFRATPGEDGSEIRIELSSPVSPARVRPHLHIEPTVAVEVRSERNTLVLRGPMRPGDRYRLTLGAGLVADDAARLAEPWVQSIRLADLAPEVSFPHGGLFLSASGPRRIELETVNVPKLELSVERVYRSNVLWLLEQRGYQLWSPRAGYGSVDAIYGDRIATHTLEVGGMRNRRTRTQLALDELVEGEAPGLYRVVATRPRARYDGRQQWALVTDLGLVAKRGEGAVHVWVFSFRDLRPVAGARVTLLSHQNQVLAQGRSDARGALALRGLAEVLAEKQAALLTVETERDWSFLPFERSRIDTAGLDVAGAPAPQSGFDAFLYGERDLYRPGETARGVAIVRDRELEVPPTMPLVLRHRDPEGQLRSETRLDLEDGVASFAHAFPTYERTGNHDLELRIGDETAGRYRVQVEEFVPDRIRVGVEPARDEVGLGDAIAYHVSSAYLFGPPAAGLAVESRVRLVSAPFQPEGHSGYRFGNDDREFSARELFHTEATLDESGRIALAVPVPRGLEPPAALEARITARVQEQGGRGVTASERVRVHPVPHYLGLRRTSEGYVEPGEPAEVEFIAVRPDGEEAATGALRADFYQDRWQTVLRRTASGSWRYESEREPVLLASERIEAGSTRGRVAFTPPEYGRYRVVLSDEAAGASSQLGFYASGWGFAPWALESPGRVELDLERADLGVGEEAVVQVRSPFPGTLLLAVEREDVLHWQLHRMEGNTAKLRVPVRADYRPNVYLTATVVRSVADLEPGTAGRAFGAVPLSVDREPNRIPLAIEAPDEIRPERELAIEIAAEPGAFVTVAAVDAGILQLIAQQTPDPFAHFYRRRALGVRSHDIFSLLLPDVEGAAPAGGGRFAARLEQFVRTEGIRRVEPVAFWSGVLRAGSDGRARVAFELPEFQGALRVMAVAHRGRRFGAAERSVRVRSPLVVLPTFPRFLSLEERALIPVTVRNDTGADAELSVSLAVEGPARVTGDATRALAVANGREATTYFALETQDTPGELALSVEASGNGESSRTGVSLGLRADLPPVVEETAGSVEADVLELPAPDADRFRPEGLSRSLRIGPVPLVQLAGKLETLLAYPYGCLEQTVSRAFPLIYVGDLARELEPALFDEQDPNALVAAGIARVASLRLASGGFSLWPGGRTPHAWGSLYATHFLIEAERAGHPLPPGLREGALAFVSGEAVAKQRYSAGGLERAVYALYVLARAGEPDPATLDFVRERHLGALGASSRALLGAAYAAAGDGQKIEALTRGLEDAERIRRQTGGNFASTTRNRALLLLALLDAAPADARIPQLARRLARDAASDRWWSTQETAMALLALGQLYRRQAERAPYAGDVLVGGAPVARFGRQSLVLGELPPGPITLRMDAGYEPGAAFYALRVRGVPTDAAFAPASQGIELERRLELRGGGAADSVEQGDLLVLSLALRSTGGAIRNVVLQQLLPAGLEVENARLATSEQVPGVRSELAPSHLDVRDDRLLAFVDLPDAKRHTYRALLRAVTPGSFRLPPAQAEAMYDGTLRATGERGRLEVTVPGRTTP